MAQADRDSRRMGITNPLHLAFIAVVALLVLGPKRLPDLARALGNGMREFREALSSATDEHQDPELPPVTTNGVHTEAEVPVGAAPVSPEAPTAAPQQSPPHAPAAGEPPA